MGMFGSSWDEEEEDDGPMFGAAERHEKRKMIKERAREISSGLVMGTFERDEEVWAEVRKQNEENGTTSVNEETEFWKDWRDENKARRQKNFNDNTEALKAFGIKFISRNLGYHLIVDDRFDFWPSTGLFQNRLTKKRGRGLQALLSILTKNEGNENELRMPDGR